MEKELVLLPASKERTLTIVTGPRIRDYLDLLEPLFQKVVDRSGGELSLEHLLILIHEHRAAAFVGAYGELVENVTVVEIVDYPALRVAVVIAIAGRNIREYMSFWTGIEKWAQVLGAREIRFQVPKAVERLWRQLKVPMTDKYKVMVRDLRSSLQ